MTSNGNSYCSNSQRTQPEGIDPPYWSYRAMRTGRTWNGGCSPVGTLCTPSMVSPLSAAVFSRIGVDSAVAGTRNDPAGYDFPLMVNGAVARDTDCLAFSSRLSAMKASFTRASMTYAPPRGAEVTLPCG